MSLFLLRAAPAARACAAVAVGKILARKVLAAWLALVPSPLVAHITVHAPGPKMSGSQAARTNRPAMIRSGCAAVEKALVDALSCGKGYITQPAVIPDNFVRHGR